MSSGPFPNNCVPKVIKLDDDYSMYVEKIIFHLPSRDGIARCEAEGFLTFQGQIIREESDSRWPWLTNKYTTQIHQWPLKEEN